MQRYIVGRLIQSVVSMFVVSVVVFALVRLSGDPIQIMMPAEASKADIELMRAHLGLDRPWHVQYWKFATQALQGDFGRSVRFRRPALDLIAERYGATLELGGLAVLVVIVVALPVGVYSAVRRGSALDYGARAFAALGQAVPPFWLGLVLVLSVIAQPRRVRQDYHPDPRARPACRRGRRPHHYGNAGRRASFQPRVTEDPPSRRRSDSIRRARDVARQASAEPRSSVDRRAKESDHSWRHARKPEPCSDPA